MTWTRFESRYPQSRKIAPLSDGAFRLDVSGICWANEEGTDGRIRARELVLVGDGKRKPKHAAELVVAGRWHAAGDPPCPSERCPHDGTAPDGWVIHDFWAYQPTRDQVQKERAARAERQRRWREKKRGNDSVSNASTRALVTPAPYRPVPPRSEGSGGGTPPSATRHRPPPPSGQAAAGGGRQPADPATVRKLAAQARAALNATSAPAAAGTSTGAFERLMAFTPASNDRPNQEDPSREQENGDQP